jgi:hypothetical protein
MSEQSESLKRMTREPEDVVDGVLEVGRDDNFQIVVNHPDLKPDENGVGHIVFSPRQARKFANLLMKHATVALLEWREAQGAETPVQREAKEIGRKEAK